MNVKGNQSYPEPRVECENLYYANLLSEVFAGSVSEETAVHLYFYQHLILEEDYAEISNILEKISIVEMHHLELLGQTIRLLGGNPIFGVNKNREVIYWNGNNVNYNQNIQDILKIDMDAEKEAIKNYEYALQVIQDKFVQELLERIIEDEKTHLQIFENLYQKLK